MVMMGDFFVGNVPKKLSKDELIQALRLDIAGELEAIMGYDAHAMATDDQRVKTILYSIRDEERQHVGELLHLMEILDPQEAQLLAKGRQEVEQLLNQKGQQGQPGQQENQQQNQQQMQQTQQYGQQQIQQKGQQQMQQHNYGQNQSNQWGGHPHNFTPQYQAGNQNHPGSDNW